MKYKILLISSVLVLSSCTVRNRVYNPVSAVPGFAPPPAPPASVVAVVPTMKPDGTIRRTDQVDMHCDPKDHPCVALLEFDELGSKWDPNQLTEALNLIGRARDEHPQPIIVTFVHGWKNNADNRDDRQNHNLTGFEGVLRGLKELPQYSDRPIVGIFIAWRGELVSPYYPIRRQFSYFDREAAAIRIPGVALTNALTEIMAAAHKPPLGPFLVMAGHSFGGLILERALSQALIDDIEHNWPFHPPAGAPSNISVWPDLVVFVNSAAAASEGIQTLDYLKSRQAQYSVSPESARLDPNRSPERPLFLSISSLGDAATRFAMPIGHGLSFLNFKLEGGLRKLTGQVGPPEVKSQGDYYMSTTAHMEALQSHVIVDAEHPAGCADKAGRSAPFGGPFGISTGQRYQICRKPGAGCQGSAFCGSWNSTPYWVMQMPATIVPDHGGIFNLNFVILLEQFLLGRSQMDRPELRPVLSVQQ